MKWWLKLTIVVVVAVAVVAAVAFVWLATVPRWTGRGDWAACATLAPIGPEAAVRAAVNALHVSLWQYQAEVAPGFVNETGRQFDVTCPGQSVVGDPVASWEEPPSDGAGHFGWSIHLGEDWTLCGIPAFVDWTTGAELLWGGRPAPAC